MLACGVMKQNTAPVGYNLALGDGRGWHLFADDARGKEVLDGMAGIMRLASGRPGHFPNLIFTGQNSAPYMPVNAGDPTQARAARGWRKQNFDFFTLWRSPESPDAVCQLFPRKKDCPDAISMYLSLYPVVAETVQSGGLPLHAGLIVKNGRGALLAGPGNIGKSTCCRRIPPPWQAWCDDETLVTFNGKQEYLVHPMPTWSLFTCADSDETWDVQRHVKLAAIFLLQQAKTGEAIIPMGKGETAARINQSATEIFARHLHFLDAGTRRAMRRQTFANACAMAKTIPAYTLTVSRDGRFWEKIEQELSW